VCLGDEWPFSYFCQIAAKTAIEYMRGIFLRLFVFAHVFKWSWILLAFFFFHYDCCYYFGRETSQQNESRRVCDFMKKEKGVEDHEKG